MGNKRRTFAAVMPDNTPVTTTARTTLYYCVAGRDEGGWEAVAWTSNAVTAKNDALNWSWVYPEVRVLNAREVVK